MNKETGTLYSEYAELDSATRAMEWIAERGSNSSMRFRLLQSYERCDFEAAASVSADNLAGTFAGRLFGTEAEIRWRRDEAKWHLWWLSEHAPEPGHNGVKATLCRPADRSAYYYLLGVWREGKYGEPHLKEMRPYPIPNPEVNSRARLEVMEYFAALDGVEDPVEALNQPRLVAYRIVGISAGKDAAPREGRR